MKNEIIEKYKKEGKVVPATYDVVFKSVMQDEKCRDFLIEIICECTKLKKNYVKKNLVIGNNEFPVKNINEKRKITDLVISVNSNIINLEMNNYYYIGLIERNDIYLNSLRSLKVGQEYENLNKIIQINFDNFELFDERTIIKFMIMDEERHIKETENYEKYHINLKRIKEKYYNKEVLTLFERRLLILALDNKKDLEKIAGEDIMMENVKEKIITLSEEDAMILCYDEEEHKEKVRRAVTATEKAEARKIGFAEGHAEGHAEGRAEGRAEGIKKGHKEGLEEGKQIIIKKLIDNGMSKEEISNVTGVSLENIKDI